MDIRLGNGAVISTDNEFIIDQHLRHGGVEIKAETKQVKEPKKKPTNND